MNNNIFENKNLDFSFEEKILFKDFSLSIPKNKVNILLGANGVGKTTFFKIISGNIKINKGVIKNNSKKIFYLPQNIIYPDITLFDYVSGIFFKDNFKWFLKKEEIQKILNVLEQFKISDKKNLTLNKLSSGELQMANTALALLSEADFLLLDEPVSNMDLINQIKTMKTIKELSKTITPCVILHDINLAHSFGDFFIGLTEGNIITGKREEFLTEDNLKQIFKGINFKIKNSDGDFYAKILD